MVTIRNDEVRAYVIGCGVVLLVFVVWAMTLLVLKFCKPNSLGDVWSGAPYTVTTTTSDTTDTTSSTLTRRKGIFGCCVVIYIILALIALVKGLELLETAAQDATVTAQKCLDVLEQTQTVVKEGLQQKQEELSETLTEVSDSLSGALSIFTNSNNNIQEEEEAEQGSNNNVADSNNTTTTETTEFWNDVNQTENELNAFSSSEFELVENAAANLQLIMDDVTQYCQDEYDLYNRFVDLTPHQTILGLLLTLSPISLLISLAIKPQSSREDTTSATTSTKKDKIIQMILLPIFGICTFITTMGCTIFWGGFVIYVDFCTGAPEPFPAAQIRPAEYAANACLVPMDTEETPPQKDLFTTLGQAEELSVDLDSLLDDLVSPKIQRVLRLLNIDFTRIEKAIQNLLELLQNLIQALTTVLSKLACADGSNLINFYERITQTGLCVNAMEGITWTCVCFLIMTIAGFTMFTLRSVLYQPVQVEAAAEEGGEGEKTPAMPVTTKGGDTNDGVAQVTSEEEKAENQEEMKKEAPAAAPAEENNNNNNNEGVEMTSTTNLQASTITC